MGEQIDRKRAWRAELRERRRTMPAAARTAANEDITAGLIRLTEDLKAGSVSAYLPAPGEPSTRGYLRWAAERGLRVLLPVSREDGLLDWAPYDGDEETEDLLGMPAPTSELLGPIAINEVDLILVPAAAVDRTGLRLGWGRGYFDKTLGSMAARPPVYAVIFDQELVDELPRELHDQPVDGVVTPAGIVTLPVTVAAS